MTPDQRTAFSAAQDQTLRDGLALTPAERVALAESLWQEFSRLIPRRAPFTVSFATFEDYWRWQDDGHEFDASR